MDIQFERLKQISNSVSVYISSATTQFEIERQIRDALLEKDFNVYSHNDIKPGGIISEEIENAIISACYSGFVLLLISEETRDSAYVYKEIQLTKKYGGKVIPVYIGKDYFIDELFNLIGLDAVGCFLPKNPTNQQIEKLLDSILVRVYYNLHKDKFWMSIGFRSARRIEFPKVDFIEAYTFFDCSRLEEVTIPRSVRYINENAFKERENILVKCYKNTETEELCKQKGIRYELIDD